ncbi:MAG: hypothetical protein E7A50_05665 [Clostridiales bacterium]|nr:hypothetical protein [Clostridiales bacterium]
MANIILSGELGVFNNVTVSEEGIREAAKAMLLAFEASVPKNKRTLEVLEYTLKTIKEVSENEIPLNLDVIFGDLL